MKWGSSKILNHENDLFILFWLFCWFNFGCTDGKLVAVGPKYDGKSWNWRIGSREGGVVRGLWA